MTLEDLVAVVKDTIQKYPQLKDDVIDLYQLAKDEIEDGGSESHECELALRDINELVGKQKV